MRSAKLALAAALLCGSMQVFTGGLFAERAEPSAAPVFREPSGEPIETAVLKALAEVPLAFTENRGQADGRVRYYVQGSRAAFFLKDDEIVISLAGAGTAPGLSPADAAAAPLPHMVAPRAPATVAAVTAAQSGVALALRFAGSNPAARVEGHTQVPGHVNYLRGSNSAGWHRNVPRFDQAIYRGLWPGVDLVLRGGPALLKYEFRVRPGARPSDIRLAYAGVRGLGLDSEGALVIETAAGPVRDSAPVSWQEVDGRRVPVASRYVLGPHEGADTFAYGFEIGSYDPAHELVIDPGLDYSTFLGGSSMDMAGGIAVDSAGNAYVVGTTQSTDFPTTTGAFDRTFNGGMTDVFVAKLDATGSSLVYATYLGGVPTPLRRGGGDNVEFGRAIAVDAGGHAYVTGLTDSSDFPTTSGAFQRALNATPDDARDAFVAKLNPSGSGLIYSTFLGGSGFDDGRSIAVDAAGNAFVTGDTGSTDFPATAGAAQTSRGGGRDAFVANLNATGSALIYATYLGGTDNEVGNGIAVGSDGDAYVVGGSRSADFPTTPHAFQPFHSGGSFENLFDAFVARLNASGALVYSTFIGGTRIDVANDVAVDPAGRAHIVGSTSSPEFPTTEGAFNRTSGGGFAAALTPDGSGLVYSTFLGGVGAAAIALDANGRAWVAGTAGAGAPTTPDAFATQNSGGSDGWLGQLNEAGSALLFATFIGGSNTDNGIDLAIDSAGHAYLAGRTLSFDFPTTTGAFDTTFAGDPTIFWGDVFVAKFGSGSGMLNPPVTRTTSNFSGTLDKNRAVVHTVLVGSSGPVDLSLNWTESRANLTLRVRDQNGQQVFFDGSTARPKTGSFSAPHAGSYHVEVANPTDRRTNYSLSVTHPVANSFPGGVSLLTLNPTTVTGGTSSTGQVALSAGAPSGGATVALSSSNLDAAIVPASVTVPAGQTSATFTIVTNSVTANTTSTISASYNGTSRSATLGVNAAGGPAMSTLVLEPGTVQGGQTAVGTATLTAPAPAGGAVVTLISSNTAVATVPASVTVSEGQTGATFIVSTSPQQFNQSSAISASHGGVTRTVILSVTASGGTSAALSSLALNPATVTGGTSTVGTVTLTSAAPSGGFVVALSSSHPAASVPASVTVAQGATSATFSIGTASVASSTSATITAAAGGVTRTATLTINPTAGSATLTVTATGRGGERVLSSPAGISVNVGSTGSASFEIGTSITLSVSNNRDAVWSGACSSGGQKRRTCSFTLNGDASVTANVQ